MHCSAVQCGVVQLDKVQKYLYNRAIKLRAQIALNFKISSVNSSLEMSCGRLQPAHPLSLIHKRLKMLNFYIFENFKNKKNNKIMRQI